MSRICVVGGSGYVGRGYAVALADGGTLSPIVLGRFSYARQRE